MLHGKRKTVPHVKVHVCVVCAVSRVCRSTCSHQCAIRMPSHDHATPRDLSTVPRLDWDVLQSNDLTKYFYLQYNSWSISSIMRCKTPFLIPVELL